MLKSLTLNGFKSFAKKSELEFGSSVTAIVGPNGSGKSNVVEAFRFVLGEQSIKSMRGKSGSDLIFKGSKSISKLNRAKVSVVFDNKNRTFILDNDQAKTLNLDFEEIEISREVYTDGTNKYSINGSDVRLKDIHELLASVHIGSSGHHIISQGQADRLLSANAKDRRLMIEDALGLKVYQIKMKDAERKLEKTQQNIKEVESLRREIAPHIRYLKKQVEKIKQAEELRISLAGTYKEYLAKQDYFLNKEYDLLVKDQTRLSDAIQDLDTRLGAFSGLDSAPKDLERLSKIQENESSIQKLSELKNELTRNMGRIEAMLEMSKQAPSSQQSSSNRLEVPRDELEALLRDLTVCIDQSLKSQDFDLVKTSLSKLQDKIVAFNSKITRAPAKQSSEFDTASLHQELEDLKLQTNKVSEEIQQKSEQINSLKQEIEQGRMVFFESQKERFEIEKERTGLASEQNLIKERMSRARDQRQALEDEIREGIVLVGKEILQYGEVAFNKDVFDRSQLEELRRTIERTKIKLEEAGASGGEDALKEYEEVTSRDEFLMNELTDLEEGMKSLTTLIKDLKDRLDAEFKNGVKKINDQFQEFFALMFGGGTASLTIVAQQTRKRSQDESTEDEEPEAVEEGVDIQVSLPQKKVRELTMLSGGERSLTSIALLFAMTQVNPPPFLVLDETDAALDEANSRRYGDMIEKLGQYSQLIVVTHNRETMSRAQTLYGITIGSDGASKLLSIKFGEAEEYAK